jgi:hypothetical protein
MASGKKENIMDVPNNDYGDFLTTLEGQEATDINRQCAEAMGWKLKECFPRNHCEHCSEPINVWFDANDNMAQLPDFRNDWNAMRILREYAKKHNFILNLTEDTKGNCCAEFVSREMGGGYFYDYASTFTEAATLAFRKCFGKGK